VSGCLAVWLLLLLLLLLLQLQGGCQEMMDNDVTHLVV
jgi:hypothetical protein